MLNKKRKGIIEEIVIFPYVGALHAGTLLKERCLIMGETIAAIATGMGDSGIGIIRISGVTDCRSDISTGE